MKIQLRISFQFLGNVASWARRHVNALLFFFFLCALALNGFIFWQYGYQAVLQEPEVVVRSVAPKESELRALIEKARSRDDSRSVIVERAFYDPFLRPEEVQ